MSKTVEGLLYLETICCPAKTSKRLNSPNELDFAASEIETHVLIRPSTT